MESSHNTRTFEETLEAAQQGDVENQFALALMYQHGKGTKADIDECIRWYRAAAESGHASACVKLGDYNKMQQDLQAAVTWYHEAYTNGYSVYPQRIIFAFLYQFCNDERYNPGKSRFSQEIMDSFKTGVCAGLTTRFLAAAYLEKNHSLSSEKKFELPEQKYPRDDLTQFHHELNIIVNWDGERELTSNEQKSFLTFLYLSVGYQNVLFTEGKPLYQTNMDRLAFIGEEKQSFKCEFGCTFCVTQEQFANKLDALRKDNRMLAICVPTHAMGLFENHYFGPNNYNKETIASSEKIAEDVFKEIKGEDYSINDPITISIDIYVHQSELIPANYPAYSELLADSASGTEPDPVYGYTVLLAAAQHGHAECVKYFLEKNECGINDQNYVGNAALHFAAARGNTECVKLLFAEMTCNLNIRNHFGSVPLHFAVQFGHIECVKLFLAETRCDISIITPAGLTAFHLACCNENLAIARLLLAHGFPFNYPPGFSANNFTAVTDKQLFINNIAQLEQENKLNRASKHVVFWVNQKILTPLVAFHLSPEQRYLVELITHIAEQANLHLILKGIAPIEEDTDKTIRNILNALKNMAENSDLKKVEKMNTLCSTLSSDFINTASINQIAQKLADAFFKAPSLKSNASAHENHPFFSHATSNKKLPDAAANDPVMDQSKKRKTQ